MPNFEMRENEKVKPHMQSSKLLPIIAGLLTLCVTAPAANAENGTINRFLLSEHGCGRATGYAEASKIVRWKHKVHVGWLDSVDGEFQVRVRTFDRSNATWSETYTIGPAYDNHGGPAMTVDSNGYLHIAYYPHHHQMRYRRSVRPNDASEWTEETQFGPPAMTYPTLVCGPDDTLYLTCRVSGDDAWRVMLFEKPHDQEWREVGTLIKSRYGGYAHFQEALARGPDHRTLHLACRMYEKNGQFQTVGYLKSDDFGRSWRRADGTVVELPVTANTIDSLASTNSGKSGLSLRCGGVAVGSDGRPHVLYSRCKNGASRAYVVTRGKDGWRAREVHPPETAGERKWQLSTPGGISFGADGSLYLALTALPADLDCTKSWGHPASEVMCLKSEDGGRSFTGRIVSSRDPGAPHWLPNLQHPTGYDTFEVPALIYTAGPAGENNRQTLSNRVYFVHPRK